RRQIGRAGDGAAAGGAPEIASRRTPPRSAALRSEYRVVGVEDEEYGGGPRENLQSTENGLGAPEPTAVEPATREEMERDQMSVNESNSTDPLVEKSRTGEKETKP
ncbi:hypothetical protein M569_09236, partial [Genlisea aurea]